ncbi:MAG: prepilin-type N-terminal cleavage/methylation domain-containing protein [Acidimicrobiia bacterium]|nr:prepilin-type N-terminal cleavage/methylation domain-containing protein [Acidimicrobiia bacterium]
MLQKLIERRHKGQEEGFTLIELMVVVLIIAILIAIAIPTFLGARQRAQDRASQSNARNALTAEKTSYTDAQVYTSSATVLSGVEPSLNFVADEVPGTAGLNNEVAVSVATTNVANDTIYIGVKSKSGNCFYIKDVTASPGTQYYKGTCPATNAMGSITFTNTW